MGIIDHDTAISAMCIFEEHIAERSELTKLYQQVHGICETRDLILDKLAPMVELAYSKISQEKKDYIVFDAEFIPEIVAQIDKMIDFDGDQITLILEQNRFDLAAQKVASILCE